MLKHLAVLLALIACDGNPAGTQIRPDMNPDAAPPSPIDMTVDSGPDATVSRLIHVAPNADLRSADGSRDHPYPTLARAYREARAGDVVFMLPGQHQDPMAPPAGVELLGSGPEVTTLNGPLLLTQNESIIGGFTIEGGAPALRITGTAKVSDLTVTAAIGIGIELHADARFTQVKITETAPDRETPEGEFTADGPSPGAALRIDDATLNWNGGLIEDAAWIGVRALNARVTLTDVDLTRIGGNGIYAFGGELNLDRVRIDQATGAGLQLIEISTEAAALDVTETAFDDTQNTGSGISILGGQAQLDDVRILGGERAIRTNLAADVTVVGVRIVDAVSGMSVGQDTLLAVNGALIQNARQGGISINRGTAVLDGLLIEDSGRYGILAADGHIEAEDITIDTIAGRGISLSRTGGHIRGFIIRQASDVGFQVIDPPNAPLTLGPGAIDECANAGLSLLDTEDLTIDDLSIRRTKRGSDDLAEGIHAIEANAVFNRLVVEGSEGAGLLLERSTVAIQTGLLTGNAEPGVVALNGPEASTFAHLEVTDNSGTGFLFITSPADLTECNVYRNRAALGLGTGEGLTASVESAVTVNRGVFHDNPGHGLYLQGSSTAEITEAQFTNNGGFCVFMSCDSSRWIDGGRNQFRNNDQGNFNACQ